MYKGPYGEIDWDGVWQHEWKVAAKPEGVGYWNHVAPDYRKPPKKNEYVAEMLRRLDFSPEYSVLDIGCGAGALALPLAKRSKLVTALDWSAGMLDLLRQKIETSGTTNITIVNQDWLQTESEFSLKPHDVVIASRSLPMGNARAAMAKMDQMATKTCYLTWRAGKNKFETELDKILGITDPPYPSYPILYNLLHQIGIYANIDLFETHDMQRFSSIDEAVSGSLRGAVLDEETMKRLREHWEHSLTEQDGLFCKENTSRWALIYWNK